MKSDFTTEIKFKPNLSDVYFMTCLESTSRTGKEAQLVGPTAKFLLFVTLAHGIGCYAADNNSSVPSNQEKYELIIGKQNVQTKHMSAFDDGKMSIEVNPASSYRDSSQKNKKDVLDKFECTQRIQMIMDSYYKNKIMEPRSIESDWVMKIANTTLSSLPFTDAILQYDSYDDVWHYNLFFKENIELSIGVFVEEETIAEVDFNIYHNEELIIANTLPFAQLVEKMNMVIKKIQNNA